MARTLKLDGVEPKQQITLKTALTYSTTATGGHTLVGKALAAGTLAGGAAAPTDGATVLGELILLETDGYATVKTFGVIKFTTTGTVVPGDKVVCSGTAGAVKAAGVATNGRGIVLPVDAGANQAYVLLT